MPGDAPEPPGPRPPGPRPSEPPGPRPSEPPGPRPSAQPLPELARLRSLSGIKWTRYGDDVLPAWVADMDLPPFPAAVDAVRSLAERGDFGYGWHEHAALPEAFAAWQERRHGWRPDAGRVRLFTSVVQAFETALWLHTKPGDGVVIFTPVYPPFFGAIGKTGCRVVDCPLDPDGWRLDEALLRSVIDETTTSILWCNPHNPTGRVFTRDELAVAANVAREHDLLVISDEIWADLTFDGARHVPFATLGEDAAARAVTVTAASKSFNVAGLHCAVAHVGHEGVLDALTALPGHLLGAVGTPGATASLAAWTGGDAWLDGTRAHIQAMRDHALARLAAELPEVGVSRPEATYLLWLDFRAPSLHALGMGDDPSAWLLEHAKVALSCGPDFGPHGRGFARLNIATTQGVLDEIIDRMVSAVRQG